MAISANHLSIQNLSPEARRALDLAAVIARNNGHTLVTPDHLATALVRQSDSLVGKLLREHFGVDMFDLRTSLERALRDLRSSGDGRAAATPPPGGAVHVYAGEPFAVSAELVTVIERAQQLAVQQRKPFAGTDHLLAAVLEAETRGTQLLRDRGLYGDRIQAISQEIPLPPVMAQRGAAVHDLVAAARDGRVPPVAERSALLQQLAALLVQPRTSVALVGEPGTGRRSLIAALAQRLARVGAHRDAPLPGLPSAVYGVNPAAVLDNPEMVIRQALAQARGGVLSLPDLHQYFGAATLTGFAEAGVLLRQAVLDGAVRLLGTTTRADYTKYLERDPALRDHLQPLAVPEPGEPEVREILAAIRSALERDYQVGIADDGLRAAYDLSKQYLAQVQPAAAVGLLQRACALVRLATSSGFRIPGSESEGDRAVPTGEAGATWSPAPGTRNPDNVVDAVDVAQALHQQTGIPMGQIAGPEQDRLVHMDEILRRRVVGQDAAISALAKAVRRARAGLKDPKRPIGSFLFLGPSGVGKTESALALAEFLFGSEDAVVALNMSEYMEKHNVARLIGAPPGYVGYEEGGQLTEAVRQRPYAVVLVDEVEKAHPDVYDLFLQILDRGNLVDGRGRAVSFRNTVIIMTSNLGTRALTYPEELPPGMAPKEAVLQAVRAHFRPEFLNRLDGVIVFDPLDRPALRQILQLMLAKTRKQLTDQQIELTCSEGALDWLLAHHTEPEYGARPLIRIIQTYVKDEISERLINGSLKPGTKVKVSVQGDRLTFRGVKRET